MILFGKRLKKLRTDANMTQQQLGDALNVTKVCICNYESGNRIPSIEILGDICNIFKVDMNYLIGTDSYVVSDNDSSYGIIMANEEINFIKELRRHKELYDNFMDNPKRTIEFMEKKIR